MKRSLTRRAFIAVTAAGLVAACGDDDEGNAGTGGSGTGGAGGGDGGGGAGGGTGGSGGGVPSGPGPEPTDPWEAPGLEDLAAFAWGVQTGDATPTSVLVSCRTTEPLVSPTLMRGVADGWEEVSSGQAYPLVDGVAHFELDGLHPDTTYAIACYGQGGIRRSRVVRFRTALAPSARRAIRFAATSCLGLDNEPWPNLSHTFDQRFDFLLLLGDTIYAEDPPDVFNFVEKYKTALSLAGLNDATAGTSVVATWDDHEIDDNWSWSTPGMQQMFDDALAAFRQAIPQGQGPGGTGIWRKLSWGDALDLIVLDCRGERLNGDYISAEQMAWLQQMLSDSTATFKVILNSVPIFDFSGTIIDDIDADDRWQGYPAQRSAILNHIRDNAITGVVWLSGDVHFGAIGQVDPPGGPGDDQWDVILGPAGAAINPASYLLTPDARMPVVITEYHYVAFEADPDSGTLVCQFIGDAGQILAEQTLQLI